MEVLAVGVIVALSLGVVLVKHLDTTLEINLKCWLLRRQGLPDNEIRKIALAAAKRERRATVLQVMDKLSEIMKSTKP